MILNIKPTAKRSCSISSAGTCRRSTSRSGSWRTRATSRRCKTRTDRGVPSPHPRRSERQRQQPAKRNAARVCSAMPASRCATSSPGTYILHFKMMLFHGLERGAVQQGELRAITRSSRSTPNVNYHDEAVFFSDDTELTNSFRRRFDDLWVNTSRFQNFANVTGPLVRRYPSSTIHPSMNFSRLTPAVQDFRPRGRANQRRARSASMRSSFESPKSHIRRGVAGADARSSGAPDH